MFNVTRLIDVTVEDRDRILASLRRAAENAGARRWVVEFTDPGSRNGGDILAHLRFTDEAQWNRASEVAAVLGDPAVGRVNGVSYHGAPVRAGTSGSVYRTLLLRVSPDTGADDVARFEAELAAMPRYVDTILSWQLSRVTDAVGDTPWTHVFEQEFTDVDGLMGPYLLHPIHWAVVDRWFDPETTDVIIRDRVCHSFCGITGPVLG